MAKKKTATRPIAAFDLDGSLVRKQLLVLLYEECFDLQIFRPVALKRFRKISLEHRDRKVTFECTTGDHRAVRRRIKKRRKDD